jgi:hypothetical protein
VVVEVVEELLVLGFQMVDLVDLEEVVVDMPKHMLDWATES